MSHYFQLIYYILHSLFLEQILCHKCIHHIRSVGGVQYQIICLLLPQYKLECPLDLGTVSKLCCRQNTRGSVVCQEVVPLQPQSGFSNGQELSFKIIVCLDVCTDAKN
jgi:hypothetical protein